VQRSLIFVPNLSLKHLIENWRQEWPYGAIGVVAVIAAYFMFRRRDKDPLEVERQRRLYLNRVGRIVEGQVLEIVDTKGGTPPPPPRKLFGKAPASLKIPSDGAGKLLYYTYSISGVTYETAQDITGFEERAALDKAVIGKAASVKYDPANPSNSILIADDWSGLH
jgi:hypothetical protein